MISIKLSSHIKLTSLRRFSKHIKGADLTILQAHNKFS